MQTGTSRWMSIVSAAAGMSPAAVNARLVPLQQVHVLGADAVFCVKICSSDCTVTYTGVFVRFLG